MNMKPVETSSHIAAVGHDPETNTMRVKFKSGATFDYANVPAEKHAAFVGADSIGKHFHQNFRANADHPATKVEEEPQETAS